MRFLLGASGSGKSVLLKLILGLFRPDSGTIIVNGQDINDMAERDLLRLRTDIGMVFQENALFDSLTVDENVGYRLYEETDMPVAEVRARVPRCSASSGSREFIDRHAVGAVGRVSGGGSRWRARWRRRPGLLLFDDPTTGLDPITATTVDDEIVKLRDLEHVTSIVATHQMRDAFYVATHQAMRAADGVRIVASRRHGHDGARRIHGAARGPDPVRGPRRRTAGLRRPVPQGVPVQDAAALVSRAVRASGRPPAGGKTTGVEAGTAAARRR